MTPAPGHAGLATPRTTALPDSSAAEPALVIENIEVVYQHTIQVLRGLSLAVPCGRIVALLGSNGAGKTTTLKAISNLLPLEVGQLRSGSIHYLGERIDATPPHLLARRGIAHVREGRHVFEDLTVEENLIVAGNALKGRGEKPDLDLIYEYFPRLRERRAQRSGYLSGGEQQMLAIGRALLGKPTLMLLDEPSLGLAPLVVEDIFRIIVRINQEQGVAMLLVEQNAMAAFGIAHYGYIMESGRIVIDGEVARLAQDADVQRFYLGYGDGAQELVSFRNIKHYKRRKRWLS
ncbi:ABC transporter ATP-binding protein [Castellaniella sp.]|uniref:ABC transporter ATP-binding protein n=1 Tax=Castellaniella sp. TaxID=1955812 RepID=UPI00355D893B